MIAVAFLVTIATWATAEGSVTLPEGPGRDTVSATCSACHSLMLVAQQGLSREVWDETLDWMIDEQGMPAPEPTERKLILDYLSTHFGPESHRPRR